MKAPLPPSNPKGIESTSPRLLAQWDRLAERYKMAEHTYPTGRATLGFEPESLWDSDTWHHRKQRRTQMFSLNHYG